MATSAPSNDLPGYKYTPLPSLDPSQHWTRVIKVLRPTNAFHIHNGVQYELAVRLKQLQILINSDGTRSKQYDALSYVWGPPSIERDSKVLVYHEDELQPRGWLICRRNLVDALTSIWDRPAGGISKDHGGDPVIWADQICINQSDKKEQSKQVAQMGLVYWNARHLHIWLGSGDSDMAKAAFDEMRTRNKEWRESTGKHAPKGKKEEDLVLSRSEVEKLDRTAWMAISEFFNAPWFQRAWVQQEIGLSCGSTFYWGTNPARHIALHPWYFFLLWQKHRAPSAAQVWGFDPVPAQQTLDSWMNYGQFTDPDWGKGQGGMDFRGSISLLSMLVGGVRCSATDPRDYVYAFLGHPSAFCHRSYENRLVAYKDLEAGTRRIQPDYEGKTVAEVYTDTAKAVVEQMQDLSVLAAVVPTPKVHEPDRCPSWVPKWNIINRVELPGTLGFWTNKPEMVWRGHELVRMDIRAEDNALGINAKIVDRVGGRVSADKLTADDVKPWWQKRMYGRAVFRTNDSGRLLAHTSCQKGDLVTFVFGCHNHLVLRLISADEYRILGPCWLHRQKHFTFGPERATVEGYTEAQKLWIV